MAKPRGPATPNLDLSQFIPVVKSWWEDWPAVPEDQRPKRLPHSTVLRLEDQELLAAKGWRPMDVRLLPNNNDAERGEALKAWLEGIRMGTIEADAKLLRFLDLEARSLGLTSNRAQTDSVRRGGEIDTGSLESIFGGLVDKPPDMFKPNKLTGRPPGSKTRPKE